MTTDWIEVEPDVSSGLAAKPMKPDGDIGFRLPWLARCAAIIVSFGVATASAAEWSLTGALRAHDPTLIEDGSVWWCFTTGKGLLVKFSPDGWRWEQRSPLFRQEDTWWRQYAPAMRPLDVWAPDLHRFGGRIWCYYCVSEFGKNNSAIGLMSCTSIAAGDWRDDGFVLGSREGHDAYNALDPSLAIDRDDKTWLVFGSWFDGIHVVPLDAGTMKPSGTMVRIARRESGIEAPNFVFANGYYYLFVSIDRCCVGVKSTYKIAYGRAKTITGPYVARDGKPMQEGGTTVLDSGDARWVGPGGQSIVHVGERWLIVHHAYDAHAKGMPTLRIRDLEWTSDGWPTLEN